MHVDKKWNVHCYPLSKVLRSPLIFLIVHGLTTGGIWVICLVQTQVSGFSAIPSTGTGNVLFLWEEVFINFFHLCEFSPIRGLLGGNMFWIVTQLHVLNIKISVGYNIGPYSQTVIPFLLRDCVLASRPHTVIGGCCCSAPEDTIHAKPMLAYWWHTVCKAGPTLLRLKLTLI